MNFDPNRRRFGWLSYVVLIAAALVLLPMAAPRAGGESAAVADETKASPSNSISNAKDQSKESRPKTNWPTIVSTNPKIGVTDVDPALKEISITFDRDMDVGGFSWTGGGEFYPPSPPDAGAVWTDERTCVLPVRLEKGAFYRVGVNSTSHHNFRSATGVPAPTGAIYFATAGAKGYVAAKVREPKVIAMAPKSGAEDVDADLKVLRVTFNVPMDPGGFSWTGGGPTFPTIPDGQKPRWSRDGKTCMLPVALSAGKRYELGLNSVSHKNFASRWGVPLAPVRYQFKTAGEAADSGADKSAGAAAPGKPPRIVTMVPENGAKDVDPSIAAIRVVFDRPMAAGFSWTGGGEQFPTIPDGKKPAWAADRKSCTLPVALKPNWTYRLGLNSRSFRNFASAVGKPLEPVIYEFRTGAGR